MAVHFFFYLILNQAQVAAPVPNFDEETLETSETCGVPPPPPAPPRHGGRKRGILLEVNREADCLVGRLRDIETQQRIIGEVTVKEFFF